MIIFTFANIIRLAQIRSILRNARLGYPAAKTSSLVIREELNGEVLRWGIFSHYHSYRTTSGQLREASWQHLRSRYTLLVRSVFYVQFSKNIM